MKSDRFASTVLAADLAFGDPLYASIGDLDAAIERQARRDRWLRRKAHNGGQR